MSSTESLCASFFARSLEDSSSSTDTSSSEEADFVEDWMEMQVLEMTCIFNLMNKNFGARNVVEKIVDYVERVIPNYSREVFKQQFRMYPETVEVILGHIGQSLRRANRIGRFPIDEKKQLLIAIWFMSTPDSYRSVKTKFGIGQATAFRAVRRVTYALHCLAPHIIKWPSGEQINQNITSFQNINGFPGVIGAIDGTHIKIRAPSHDAESYINRKGFHSIQLQVICNARNQFIHCYAGHPGSVHDARVFRNSKVYEFLDNSERYFPNDSHLLGDSAYPLHNHLLVPFRDNGHLTERQKKFNYCLSSTRMTIERSIGLLKVRFRILLDCLPLWDIRKIPEFIMACCVLHNICMAQNDFIDLQIEHMPRQEEVENNLQNRRLNEAVQKRNNIMNTL